MFTYLVRLYKEYKENSYARRWMKRFESDVRTLYNKEYSTEDIIIYIRCTLSINNDVNDHDVARLLRNVPRLVRSFHPSNPTYFESIP